MIIIQMIKQELLADEEAAVEEDKRNIRAKWAIRLLEQPSVPGKRGIYQEYLYHSLPSTSLVLP